MLRWVKPSWRMPWAAAAQHRMALRYAALMRYPRLSRCGAALLGIAVVSPWCLSAWDDWAQAQATQAQHLAKQVALTKRQAQTKQLRQNAPSPVWADANALMHLAQQQGLRVLRVQVQPPTQPAAWQTLPAAVRLEAQGVQLGLQGSWQAWQQWLAQWPSAAPGVTVSALTLQAEPQTGLRFALELVAPQATAQTLALASSATSAFAPASASVAVKVAPVDRVGAQATVGADSFADPFDVQAWATAQRVYAQRHPSYARWVAPELARAREALEAYPLARLRYVGHISAEPVPGSGSESAPGVSVRGRGLEALIKVLPDAEEKKNAKTTAALTRIYRVRVGQYLGTDFGRVQSIAPQQIQLRELVSLPSGEWQTRDAQLTLQEADRD